jgi:hypothetical protein
MDGEVDEEAHAPLSRPLDQALDGLDVVSGCGRGIGRTAAGGPTGGTVDDGLDIRTLVECEFGQVLAQQPQAAICQRHREFREKLR